MNINIDADKVSAFASLAQTLNYSKAARNLSISQPALSKKISRLEEEMGTTLLIRSKRKVELTQAGKELMLYWQSKTELDRELMGRLGNASQALNGTIRVAGFSTITSSVVIPSLAPILTSNPHLKLELLSREMDELTPLLLSGQVDFILTCDPVEKEHMMSQEIGSEELIHVRPIAAKKDLPWLDHDANDLVTLKFLRLQGVRTRIERHFVDDIHAIIAGVQAGLGQAVISKHLYNPSLMKQVSGTKPMGLKVYLCYMKKKFMPALQQRVIDELIKNFPKILSRRIL